jgi:hypothetical protein
VGLVVTPLSNGNYVVGSPYWNGGYPNGRGAVTWGNGSIGVSGTISGANSLIGNNPGDQVGWVMPLKQRQLCDRQSVLERRPRGGHLE